MSNIIRLHIFIFFLFLTTCQIQTQTLKPDVNYKVIKDSNQPFYNAPNVWWHSGLRSGDDIIYHNNQKISTAGEFREILSRHSVGDTIHINYIREGYEFETDVKLEGYKKVNVLFKDIPLQTHQQIEMHKNRLEGKL